MTMLNRLFNQWQSTAKTTVKKMAPKQFEEKTGTFQAYITQLFRGNRKPNLNILEKIQKALEI
jgi:transcriptional regulator with XRE-family HTH domain